MTNKIDWDNKEEVKKYYEDYYIKNKEKISIDRKEKYQKNKKEIRLQQKEYRENNREKINKHKREVHTFNKDEINTKRREKYQIPEVKQNTKNYYLTNREAILEKKKEYRKRNRNEINEYLKKYRERPENKLKIKEYDKKRYQNNKEKIKAKTKEYHQKNNYLIWRKEYDKTYSQRPEVKLRKISSVCIDCGKKIWNRSKRCYSCNKLGERSPLWQGGKFVKQYSQNFNEEFKEAIRERDNRCCVICNRPEEELKYTLSVHHIDYNKKNSFPQNCVSLCRNHHTDTTFNRNNWTTFFQSLLKERYNYEYVDNKILIRLEDNQNDK